VWIEDLQSSNGTFVNGQRIAARTQVAIGDVLTFSDLRFRLTTEAAGQSDATQLFVPPAAAQTAYIPPVVMPVTLTPPPDYTPMAAQSQSIPQKNLSSPSASTSADNSHEEQEQRTRLYSSAQIASMAQRNLDHYADLNMGNGPRFVVLTAPLRGQVCAIGFPDIGTALTLGRDDSCDLCIPEASVSRHHATITYSGLQFLIDATQASNTLLINGKPQQSSSILRHGDKVQIGRIDVIFRTDTKTNNEVNTELDATTSYWKWGLAIGFTIATLAAGIILLV
jgi:pSer/pThr/pTyr-binding forkhead associated (FHA) protein